MKKNENEKNKLLYLLLFAHIHFYLLLFAYIRLFSLFSKKIVNKKIKKLFLKSVSIIPPVQTQEKQEKLPHMTPYECKRMSKTTPYECKRNKQDNPIRT